jgi:hypothetical protein
MDWTTFLPKKRICPPTPPSNTHTNRNNACTSHQLRHPPVPSLFLHPANDACAKNRNVADKTNEPGLRTFFSSFEPIMQIVRRHAPSQLVQHKPFQPLKKRQSPAADLSFRCKSTFQKKMGSARASQLSISSCRSRPSKPLSRRTAKSTFLLPFSPFSELHVLRLETRLTCGVCLCFQTGLTGTSSRSR